MVIKPKPGFHNSRSVPGRIAGVLSTGSWVIAGLWASLLAVVTAVTYLGSEGSFDYVEGVTLGHQLMLADGLPLYETARDQPPFSVPLYGPLFYWINGLMLDPDAVSLITSRVLNLLATLFLCALAFILARQRLGTGIGAALLASILWLILEPAATFLLQNRPDTLALAFGAGGFAMATSRHRLALSGAALMLTAAAYTKQMAVVAPLVAALLVLVSEKRLREAVLFFFMTAGFGLTALVVLNIMTGGSYWDSAIASNLNGFAPGSALQAWIKAGRQPLFWLALLAMLYQLRSPGAHRAISLFGLVSLAVHGLAVGKVGANSNYFLEYSWCAALALAPLFDRLIRQATANTAHVMLTIVVMLASVHSLSQATTSLKHLRETAALWPDYIEWLNEWQQSVCGPVASIRPGAQLLQGFEPYILDPHIIARLSEQNDFDESMLIEDLEKGNIAAVIAAEDITASPGAFSNWSIAVRNAVAQHYVKADAFGYLSVWVAKTSTDTDCNRPATVGSSQSLSEPDRPVYTVTSKPESATWSLSGARYRTRTHTTATSPPGLFLF